MNLTSPKDNKEVPKPSMLTLCFYISGFKVSNTSCCKVDTTIGGLCLSNANVCKNRSEYVFWDAFHPTDAANAVLADRFFSKMFTTPNSSKAIAPNHNG